MIDWTPSRLPCVVAWFDSRRGVINSSGGIAAPAERVAIWTDCSGEGNNVSESTDGNRPTFDGIKLNFASSGRLSRGATLALPQPYSVIVASQQDTNDGRAPVFAPQSSLGIVGYENGGTGARVGAASGLSIASSVALGKPDIISAILNGAGSYGRANGAEVLFDCGAGDITNFRVGWRTDSSLYLEGWIAEIIVCRCALPISILDRAEKYLRAKWGI